MEIRRPTADELRAFYGYADFGFRDVFCGVVDGRIVAVSGTVPDPRYEGTIFEDDYPFVGFLELAPGVTEGLGPQAVRAIRRYLRAQTQPIIVQHDDGYPKAERLLRVLGLTPTDDFRIDLRANRPLRIWIWQPSLQSQPSPV